MKLVRTASGKALLVRTNPADEGDPFGDMMPEVSPRNKRLYQEYLDATQPAREKHFAQLRAIEDRYSAVKKRCEETLRKAEETRYRRRKQSEDAYYRATHRKAEAYEAACQAP